MTVALYPGSFDPVTNGHIDLIERSLKICDKLIIAVAKNPNKKTLFSWQERIELLEKVILKNGYKDVKVMHTEGLLIRFARAHNVNVIIRGLRAVSDFEYEFQMALMNRHLEERIETVFMMPGEEYTYLSSSLIKEVAKLGGDFKRFVPDCVAEKLIEKFKK